MHSRLLQILGFFIRELAFWQEVLVDALEGVEADDGARDIALRPRERYLQEY